MARVKYAPEVKAKILEAAQAARANGRGWDEALMLAKNEGYSGSAGSLIQLVRNATGKKSGSKPRRKPGRKPKAAPTPAAAPVDQYPELATVKQMVESLIQNRIKTTFAKLRAVIDEAERGL